MKYEVQAIGTHWWIEIYDKDVDKNIIKFTEELFNEFEQNYSRFIQSSFVSRLNTTKEITDYPLEMYNMFLYSEELREITDGHFNVTVGTILEKLGYDENYSFTQTEEIRYSEIQNGILELTPEKVRISESVKVDFGGIGKGWLIDKLKLHFKDRGIKNYYINGGGDIYATSNFGDPVEFLLESPFDTDSAIGSIKIKDCAIACSSPSKRQWRDKKTGVLRHHLVSSKLENVNNKIVSVFTQANTSLQADSAATCLFISPMENAIHIAEELEVEFAIILSDKSYASTQGFKGEIFS
jgi:FAD:protein FMN transferase